MKTEKYNVTGMTCAACQANVTRCVSKLEGVEDVNVSLLANQMTVSYDETKLQPDTIVQAVEKIGYGASSLEQQPAALEKGGFRSEWMARQDQAIAHQKEMKQRGHTKEEMEPKAMQKANMMEILEQEETQVLLTEVMLQIKMAVGERMERRDGQATTPPVRLVVIQ